MLLGLDTYMVYNFSAANWRLLSFQQAWVWGVVAARRKLRFPPARRAAAVVSCTYPQGLHTPRAFAVPPLSSQYLAARIATTAGNVASAWTAVRREAVQVVVQQLSS
jgi:hypothetical protein